MNHLDTIFLLVLLFEVPAMFYFYRTNDGSRAVYHAWYAWIIDLLGVASGCFLMILSIYTARHRELFLFEIYDVFLVVLFVIGSWQASIHAVKWTLRVFPALLKK
jgi:hypothetical protein